MLVLCGVLWLLVKRILFSCLVLFNVWLRLIGSIWNCYHIAGKERSDSFAFHRLIYDPS